MKLTLLNAILRLHESNIRNLHWNSIGEEFDDSHKAITEEYYGLFAENIDKVSEIMGMLGINPPNYIEVVGIIKESGENHLMVNSDIMYTRTDIIPILDSIFGDVTKTIIEVLEEPEIKDPYNTGIKAELESMLYTFDFQRRYINKRRLG